MKNNIRYFSYILSTILFVTSSYAMNSNEQYPNHRNCIDEPELQLKRSNELNELAKEDQKARENWQHMTENEIMEMEHTDLIRRKRVGEIFGEGCFKMPADYMSAALIYQHGDTPDHYYQAYIWSKRASELGDEYGKHFSALAIDRYLISIGKKQLFGSQYQKQPPNHCFCMQPVEQSFPDDFRKEYSGRSIEDNYKLMISINEAGCPSIECQTSLKPTLKGSVIGLW
jgi:hypothetical protein